MSHLGHRNFAMFLLQVGLACPRGFRAVYVPRLCGQEFSDQVIGQKFILITLFT